MIGNLFGNLLGEYVGWHEKVLRGLGQCDSDMKIEYSGIYVFLHLRETGGKEPSYRKVRG